VWATELVWSSGEDKKPFIVEQFKLFKILYNDDDDDIFVNCNWVDTRWQ